jgi:UDP-N-acetylmuramoyl-L-alanyl-D-glutamate--2,6-diaminopimelate ligase
MEVSSHGIDQGRIEGIRFAGGIFTNLTHEHLDYHGDFITYRDTKKKFFDTLPESAFALTNADDKNGLFMLQNTKADKYTYALKNPADFKTEVLEMDFDGMLLKINTKEIWVKPTGLFNAYNLTAVYGAAVLLGMDADEALVYLSKSEGPAGRFERVMAPDGRVAIIDYAHTPDALENVLKTVNKIRKEGRQLITVVGAGGDRDKEKRPEMARIAAEHSDWVILTSDNPRTEDPAAILNDMLQGISPETNYKTLVIQDRSQAIKAAAIYAKPGDIILIAGKGHETYQIVGKEKIHFDDKEEITKHFKS